MASTTHGLLTVGAVTAVLAATYVASVVGDSDGSGLVPRAAAGELEPFDDCTDVRDWYVDAALPHVTAWGLDEPYYGPVLADAAEAVRREAPVAETGSSATGTNVQEADVDEPDIAKTNGSYVVTLRGGDLVVTGVSGGEPAEVGRVDVRDAWRGELLLVGDHAVITTTPLTYSPLSDVRYAVPDDATVTTVDLSDPERPTVDSVRRIDGEIVSAREHDGVVRVAVASRPSLPFVHPGPGRTLAEARAENRAIVRGSSAHDWLPTQRMAGVRAPLVDCGDLRHPKTGAGLGTVTVLTMDPAEPTATDATAVAADGSMVYASTDRLYVATTDGGWSWIRRGRDDGPTTDIHAFATDDTSTTYVASGSVPGYVPDRWAFSEYDGVLRVAAEQGAGWNLRETVVSALEEDGSSLEVVGSVGGIGRGEQIKAVRWFGDLGVVVTFRQTDPLYTLDLSEPARPRIAGELKVRGYSAYLHPVGDDLLAGVGQDANARGTERGLQVSTFDIASVAHPSRVAKLELGGRWSYSPLEHDSRAFTYLPDERLMFVPSGGDREGSRIEVVRVDRSGGLHPYATLPVRGWSEAIRTLPLDDGRVAVVVGGRVVRVV